MLCFSSFAIIVASESGFVYPLDDFIGCALPGLADSKNGEKDDTGCPAQGRDNAGAALAAGVSSYSVQSKREMGETVSKLLA